MNPGFFAGWKPFVVSVFSKSSSNAPRFKFLRHQSDLCGNQNFTVRSSESPRRPPRHRRDACSMSWRCRFLTARRSQRGHVIVEK